MTGETYDELCRKLKQHYNVILISETQNHRTAKTVFEFITSLKPLPRQVITGILSNVALGRHH